MSPLYPTKNGILIKTKTFLGVLDVYRAFPCPWHVALGFIRPVDVVGVSVLSMFMLLRLSPL